MLSKFNNKKHRRLTAMLLCAALMLGSVTSVSADISAADSETEVQNYAEEPTTEAVSYGAPEAQTEVQEVIITKRQRKRYKPRKCLYFLGFLYAR